MARITCPTCGREYEYSPFDCCPDCGAINAPPEQEKGCTPGADGKSASAGLTDSGGADMNLPEQKRTEKDKTGKYGDVNAPIWVIARFGFVMLLVGLFIKVKFITIFGLLIFSVCFFGGIVGITVSGLRKKNEQGRVSLSDLISAVVVVRFTQALLILSLGLAVPYVLPLFGVENGIVQYAKSYTVSYALLIGLICIVLDQFYCYVNEKKKISHLQVGPGQKTCILVYKSMSNMALLGALVIVSSMVFGAVKRGAFTAADEKTMLTLHAIGWPMLFVGILGSIFKPVYKEDPAASAPVDGTEDRHPRRDSESCPPYGGFQGPADGQKEEGGD